MTSIQPATETVKLPWAAWYQDESHALSLPDRWQVDVLEPTVRTREARNWLDHLVRPASRR